MATFEFNLTGHTCATCLAPILSHRFGGAGYGEGEDGRKHCYACCAKLELANMLATGRATLYHVRRDGKSYVTDWPGKLEFRAFSYAIRHNMRRAGGAEFISFNGPDGFVWSGRNIGDQQCFNARRTKQRWRKSDAALAKLAEWRKLAEGRTVDEHDMIRSPGKFEGEHISALAFYDAWLDGCADQNTRGEFIELDPAERELLGARRAYVGEDGNGFFYVTLR